MHRNGFALMTSHYSKELVIVSQMRQKKVQKDIKQKCFKHPLKFPLVFQFLFFIIFFQFVPKITEKRKDNI